VTTSSAEVPPMMISSNRAAMFSIPSLPCGDGDDKVVDLNVRCLSGGHVVQLQEHCRGEPAESLPLGRCVHAIVVTASGDIVPDRPSSRLLHGDSLRRGTLPQRGLLRRSKSQDHGHGLTVSTDTKGQRKDSVTSSG
jgi:hypothetical protein